MKVTSCYGIHGFDDINVGLKIYQELLGCKVVHHPPIPGMEYYVLEDANGNRTDIISAKYGKTGYHGTRINVDNIDEAIDLFTKNGAKLTAGPFDNPTTKVAGMEVRGNNVVLFEHIKK